MQIAAALPAGRAAVFGRYDLDLNFIALCRDQRRAAVRASCFGDSVSMESIRPDNADPVPLRMSHRSMTTLIVRFVGLLIATIAVMALIYS
jgi:hypothetical protein